MCCLRLLLVLYIRPHSGHVGFCCWWRSSKGEPPSSDTGPGSPGHVYQFEHPLYSLLLSPKRLNTIPTIAFVVTYVTISADIMDLACYSCQVLFNLIPDKSHTRKTTYNSNYITGPHTFNIITNSQLFGKRGQKY